MTRNLTTALLALPCLLQLSGPSCAEASQSVQQQLVVQSSKADSRLLVEIPEMIQAWTDRCSEKEKANHADVPECWREAVTAAGKYAEGFSGPLAEEARRMQLIWLHRAGQRQSSRPSPVDQRSPVGATAASVSLDDIEAEQSADTRRPVRKKAGRQETHRARKAVAALSPSELKRPANQRKKLSKAKRPAHIREVKVTPTAYVSEPVRPGEKAAASAPDHRVRSVRKAQIKAIHEELERIADRIECLSRPGILDGDRCRRAPARKARSF